MGGTCLYFLTSVNILIPVTFLEWSNFVYPKTAHCGALLHGLKPIAISELTASMFQLTLSFLT
jgi:hypothetical protein